MALVLKKPMQSTKLEYNHTGIKKLSSIVTKNIFISTFF